MKSKVNKQKRQKRVDKNIPVINPSPHFKESSSSSKPQFHAPYIFPIPLSSLFQKQTPLFYIIHITQNTISIISKIKKKIKKIRETIKNPFNSEEIETEHRFKGERMCLVFTCDKDERVTGRYAAPGACPYCGGMVQAMDVQSNWSFCFVPLTNKTKRKHYCTICSRRLVVQ